MIEFDKLYTANVFESFQFYFKITKNCLNQISVHKFSEENIERCTGRNFLKAHNYAKEFEFSRLQQQMKKNVSDYFLDKCIYYIDSQDFYQDSCRFLEQDIKEMIDKDMNFFRLFRDNERNYKFLLGILFLNVDVDSNNPKLKFYDELIVFLESAYATMKRRKVIINNQKELVIQKLKDLIKELIEKFKEELIDFDRNPNNHKFEKKTDILIRESLENFIKKHPRFNQLPYQVNFKKGHLFYNYGQESKYVTAYKQTHPEPEDTNPFDLTGGPIIKISTDPSLDLSSSPLDQALSQQV